jgi:hypothetical protein
MQPFDDPVREKCEKRKNVGAQTWKERVLKRARVAGHEEDIALLDPILKSVLPGQTMKRLGAFTNAYCAKHGGIPPDRLATRHKSALICAFIALCPELLEQFRQGIFERDMLTPDGEIREVTPRPQPTPGPDPAFPPDGEIRDQPPAEPEAETDLDPPIDVEPNEDEWDFPFEADDSPCFDAEYTGLWTSDVHPL